MTELLEQYLRLGLVHFMAYPETIKDESLLLPTVEKVATDPMFRFLEIKAIGDRTLVEPVRRMAASAGIGLGLAAQPAMLARRLDPGSAEPRERKRALKVLRHHLEQACAMGAESLALLSGPDPGEENKRAEALSRTADFLAELCDHSLSAGGPVIVLEVFDRSVDKKALVGPAETAARLCDLVYARGAENFGVLVNLAHLPLLGETPYEALVPVADYLKAARLGNAVLEQGHPLYGDQHPGFGTAGGANKVGQVRDFIHMLKNVGFLNRKEPPVVSLEVKPSAGETGDWVVACAKRVLLRAWALA